jgi:hypothetical protein
MLVHALSISDFGGRVQLLTSPTKLNTEVLLRFETVLEKSDL